MKVRDGDRILPCWKFMLLYFRFAGKTKYAIEAFNMFTNVNAICSTRLAAQIKWSRVVNTRGGQGNSHPVDLYMEHLNRCLKDYIIGLNWGKCIGEDSSSLWKVFDWDDESYL